MKAVGYIKSLPINDPVFLQDIELFDEGLLVTTRQETLTGLTAENIQAMHIKQESGTMMGGEQVLVL